MTALSEPKEKPFWECDCPCHSGGHCETQCCRICATCGKKVKLQYFEAHEEKCNPALACLAVDGTMLAP